MYRADLVLGESHNLIVFRVFQVLVVIRMVMNIILSIFYENCLVLVMQHLVVRHSRYKKKLHKERKERDPIAPISHYFRSSLTSVRALTFLSYRKYLPTTLC